MFSELKAGMVITVEPGCYFNETYIKKQLAKPEIAKFINTAVLDRFMKLGLQRRSCYFCLLDFSAVCVVTYRRCTH